MNSAAIDIYCGDLASQSCLRALENRAAFSDSLPLSEKNLIVIGLAYIGLEVSEPIEKRNFDGIAQTWRTVKPIAECAGLLR
jgi:hypothetical protein